MKTIVLFLFALMGLLSPAYAQVAADPIYWANLENMKFKKFGLSTLDLRMNYFGEFLGPNLAKLDDNQYDQTGAKTRDPIIVLHSLNIHTPVTDSLRFTLSPRFMTPVGDKNDLRQTDDQSSLMMDDWTLGLTQNWIRGEKWTFDSRLSERIPTSIKSKNDNVDGQTELRQSLGYRFRPELSMTTQFNIRYYHYNAKAEEKRYRLNQTTFVNYVHTDRWNWQIMHEYEQQHRAPTTGKRQRDFNHTTKYKDQLALGVGYNFTRTLNLMPFVKALDNANIRPETLQAGLWLSANIF